MTAPIYSSGKQSRSDVGHSTNIRTAFYICQTLLKNKISEQHLRSNEGGFPTATKRMLRLLESSHGQNYRFVVSHKVHLHAILQMIETHKG